MTEIRQTKTDTWENGVLITGFGELFHDNGQLEGRGNFKDGKQDGLWEFFNENGNLIGTETYRNGELIEENLNP